MLDLTLAEGMLRVCRAEFERRRREVNQIDDPDWASERWWSEDEPFVAELCLALLLGLWHQLEHYLIRRVAAVGPADAEMDNDTYAHNRMTAESDLRAKEGIDRLGARLELRTHQDWHAVQSLRLIANSYKHEPNRRPREDLLRHIGLPDHPPHRRSAGYAPMPESGDFRKGLANYLGLPERADWCDVTEAFIERTRRVMLHVHELKIYSKLDIRVSLLHFWS